MLPKTNLQNNTNTINTKKKNNKSVSFIVNYLYNSHNKISFNNATTSNIINPVINLLSDTKFLLLKYENTKELYNIVLPGLAGIYFTHYIYFTKIEDLFKYPTQSTNTIYCQLLIITNKNISNKIKCSALVPIITQNVKFVKCIFINFIE